MSADRDGFKRGTNYCYRSRMANYDPLAELATAVSLATTQGDKCARGEHDEATSEPSRVTYVRGRRVPVGTRYCRWCSTILAEGAGPVP